MLSYTACAVRVSPHKFPFHVIGFGHVLVSRNLFNEVHWVLGLMMHSVCSGQYFVFVDNPAQLKAVEDGMSDGKAKDPVIFKVVEVRLTVVARFEDDVSTGFRVDSFQGVPLNRSPSVFNTQGTCPRKLRCNRTLLLDNCVHQINIFKHIFIFSWLENWCIGIKSFEHALILFGRASDFKKLQSPHVPIDNVAPSKWEIQMALIGFVPEISESREKDLNASLNTKIMQSRRGKATFNELLKELKRTQVLENALLFEAETQLAHQVFFL